MKITIEGRAGTVKAIGKFISMQLELAGMMTDLLDDSPGDEHAASFDPDYVAHYFNIVRKHYSTGATAITIDLKEETT